MDDAEIGVCISADTVDDARERDWHRRDVSSDRHRALASSALCRRDDMHWQTTCKRDARDTKHRHSCTLRREENRGLI